MLNGDFEDLILKNFGTRLQWELEKRNKSRAWLAQKVFIGKGQIDKYCAQKGVPSLFTFLRICKVLNVSTDYMIGWNEDYYYR